MRIVIGQVKATGGDTHLGGEDFDNKLVDWAVSEFEKQHGAGRTNKLKANNRAIRRLRTACENAKRAVSSAPTTTLEVLAKFLSRMASVLFVEKSRCFWGILCVTIAVARSLVIRDAAFVPPWQVESLLDDADLSVELSREKFEALNDELFTR